MRLLLSNTDRLMVVFGTLLLSMGLIMRDFPAINKARLFVESPYRG
jgi:hypothetical protein